MHSDEALKNVPLCIIHKSVRRMPKIASVAPELRQ